MKHEQLINKENEIKENLDNEVTKIKESLENFLSQYDNIIKISQKIIRGIDKFKNEEKNILKSLSYISKIVEIKNEFKNLFQKKLISLNFYYGEEKSDIEYEKYYFKGIPIPYEIIIEYLYDSNVKISWNNINVENIDNNKIKYIVEKRKENETTFKQIYEGNNNSFSTENYNKNNFNEIRICVSYDGIRSEYNNIKKPKILPNLEIDSKILFESKKYEEFKKLLLEWTGFKKMELIFRGSRDGMTCQNFRSKCNKQGPTIVLIKNDKDNIFGGYASTSWDNNNIWESASNSFIFTLTNIFDIEPTKFFSKGGSEIGNYDFHGPNFGFTDIYFCYNFNENNNSYSDFPKTYQDNLGKGKSLFTGDSNINNNKIILKEIEVFKLFQ